ncbi:6-phosphogluconolactonase [Candidatus Gottesmanbacteria bacterium]|nr:6-phosphogluconolactonase [Candidatus Gottesmanbacteria bacterium]
MSVISYERVEIHTLPSTGGVPLGFWENRILELKNPELSHVYVLPTHDEAARLTAEMILEVVKQKPDAAISFPTGNQAKSVYEKLAKLAAERQVSFADVKAFHLDEYFPISADHPDSFRKYLRENVWTPLGINPANIHEIPADPGTNGEAVAAGYEALLAAQDIDLVLHPIGCGGHIGFNEKGTPKELPTHITALSPETVHRDQVVRKQTSPVHAITQGISTILKAKKIIFIDFDPQYKESMNEALNGPVSSDNPSSFLRTVGDKVTAIMTSDVGNAISPRPVRTA